MKVARYFGRALALAALAAFTLLGVASCSPAGAYLAVAAGNSAYERGRYEAATVDYLRAAQKGVHLPWISYDLGNVYHALGEPAGATEEWARAEKDRSPLLRTAASFNAGILDYELGSYRAAYEKFRSVLEIDPADMNAKINLELAYKRMTVQEHPPAAASANEKVGIEYNRAAAHTLLNLVRQQQGSYWVSPKPEGKQPRGPDY